MSEIAISVENLSKVYKLYNKNIERLKEAMHPLRKKYHRDFYAVKDLNFKIKKGETVGIIGRNGAGKSTLLKILTGVLVPTEGSYEVKGNISSLLELGLGFNPELTGMENIYFNGAILGYSKQYIDDKLDQIIEFADIGEYLYQPIKSYSSGMQVRLAFSIAVSTDPNVLIVDEALAVGDVRFQQKCFRLLKKFQEEGKTIVFVTHDMGSVINYCSRAIWLKDGQIHQIGEPAKICKQYIAEMLYGNETLRKSSLTKFRENLTKDLESVQHLASFGIMGAEIKRVGVFSSSEEKIKSFYGGEMLKLRMEFAVKELIEKPIVGFLMNDKYGNHVLGMNSYVAGTNLNIFKPGEVVIVEFRFDFPDLRPGNYSFSVAIAEGTQIQHIQHHWVHDAYEIEVLGINDNDIGCYFMPTNCEIEIKKISQ